MLRSVVDVVPAAVLVLVVVGATVGIVLLGVWAVRRWVPATRDGFDAEVSSQVLGAVASLFGLLAFVMIELESFNAASDDVQTEADDLAAVVRDSYAFDAPGGTRIRSAIGTYVRLVLDKEWPLMRHGQESPAAWQSIDEVFGAMRAYTPVSASQSMFYEDSVRHLNAVLEARSDRVSASDGVIVGFSLVVLLSLQFPFSGNLAISSQPFKEGALAPFSARQS